MHTIMHNFWECCTIVNIIGNLLFLLLNFIPPQAMGQGLFFGASWFLWVMVANCDIWFSTNLELLRQQATWGAWCWSWVKYWGLVGQQGMDQCTEGPDCLRCCECVTLYPAVFAFSCVKKACIGTSLVVQGLRLWAPNTGGPGSIPGPGN